MPVQGLTKNLTQANIPPSINKYIMLTIRLSRTGKRHKPQYRIVLQEKGRDPWSPAQEILGTYNPHTSPSTINLEEERITYWLGMGAQPSNTVANMLMNAGLMKADKKAKSVAISKKRAGKLTEKAAEAEEAKKAAAEKKKADDEAAAEAKKAETEAKKVEAEAAKAAEAEAAAAPAEEVKEEAAPEATEEKKEEAPAEEVKAEEPKVEEKKEDSPAEAPAEEKTEEKAE